MRRLWLVVLLVVVVWFLWSACGPSPGAEAATRHHYGPARLTITRTTGPGICSEHPDGVLAGWVLRRRADGPWPSHQWHYTYGPWAGSFCSNGKTVWGVNWGGSPDGSSNGFLFWTWYPSDTKLADNDNVGAVRYRKWRTHFGIHVAGFGRDEYPWLSVRISTNARVSIDDGCGC